MGDCSKGLGQPLRRHSSKVPLNCNIEMGNWNILTLSNLVGWADILGRGSPTSNLSQFFISHAEILCTLPNACGLQAEHTNVLNYASPPMCCIHVLAALPQALLYSLSGFLHISTTGPVQRFSPILHADSIDLIFDLEFPDLRQRYNCFKGKRRAERNGRERFLI